MDRNIEFDALPATRAVHLELPDATLEGDLTLPDQVTSIILFAHGSGSSRHSPRNQNVAAVLHRAGLATLLMDLLTQEEDAVDEFTRQYRFDIALLSGRLIGAIDWLAGNSDTRGLPIGLFGASTGAAAALGAAAARPDIVRAVVSRGGRPDLAGDALDRVQAPVLLIVGANDTPVIPLNDVARRRLRGTVEMVLVPGATHLFEEPGTLAEASRLSKEWFLRHLDGEGDRVTGE